MSEGGAGAAVRRASLDDLDALAPLFDAYRQFYGQPGDLGVARAFLHDRLAASESVVFIAHVGGDGAGFTQLYPSFSSARARRILILNDLYVAPAARGRGVARGLLAAAAEHGRREGAARLTLSTAVTNTAAQALYASAGWVKDEAFLHYTLPL